MASEHQQSPKPNGADHGQAFRPSGNRHNAARRIAKKQERTLPDSDAPALDGRQRRVAYWLVDKARILFQRLTVRELLTAILLMIPSAATTMLTYFGVSVPMAELGGTVVDKGQALAFSLTIGVFAWLGWFYLFGLLYWLKGRRLGASLAAGVFFVTTLAAIDAPFNMLALGGGPAVQMSLVDTTRHYETRKDEVFAQATITRRIIPALRAQSERFEELRVQEFEGGAFSGSPGAGKVAAGFGQIAVLLTSLTRELDTGLAQSADLQAEIADQFSAMKQHAYLQGPIRPRVSAVSVTADRLDDLLGQLEQFDYAISISATLSSLESIFPAPTAARSDFERTQNAELAMIAEMSRPVAQSLRAALEELDDVASVQAERLRPMSEMDAIRHYWRPLLPQWLAALFIDFAPAALLIILICAYREVEEADRAPDTGRRNSREVRS
jgi:hypothetical protein